MSDRRDRKKDLGQKVRKQYRVRKRNAVLSVLYVAITCAAIAAMVWLEIMPEKYSVTVGEAAEETIIAIRDVEDSEQTAQQKQAARDAVPDIFVADQGKTKEITDFFNNVFSGFKTVSEYGNNTRAGQINGTDGYVVQYDPVRQDSYSQNELSFLKDSRDMLSNEAMSKSEKIIAILDSSPQDVDKLHKWFKALLDNRLKSGINDTSLENMRLSIIKEVKDYSEINNSKLKLILAEVVEENLTANCVVDLAATEEARALAEQAVEPVIIRKGSAIVSKDTTVTQAQYDMLEELGMLEESKQVYPYVIGSIALIAVLLFIAVWYIWIFDKKTVAQPAKVLLLCILMLVDVLIALLLKSGGWERMMNAAIGTILIAMLFNEQLALVINTILSVVLALFISDEAGVFTTDAIAIMITSLTGGMAAIYVCKNVRTSSTRGKMLLPGFAAGIVGMLTAFAVMWTAGREMGACIQTSVYSLAGGAIAAIFSAASQPVWESMFGLLTQSKLLELSNSSSDLLRRMSLEIPGTYQHSTSVAEMAENGAKDIGANPMLARVGALYHDIGKLRCPECYTENQTEESKGFHSTLAPKESARMIFSHITEGVQIAKANKLPREIIDIIREHHGTSAVMYFYNKAREADPETKISDFRYPGPNPQTKVAGIIMLADCIEASVRSMDEKTHDSIKAQIERMFKVRMDDGELDDCELTLRDINVLKHSFLNTLTAVYHTRIKYQENKDDRNN